MHCIESWAFYKLVCSAQNSLSSVIFLTKILSDQPNQKWSDIMTYQIEEFKV